MWLFVLFSLIPALISLTGCVGKSSQKSEPKTERSTSAKASQTDYGTKSDVTSKRERTERSESVAQSVKSESVSSVVTSTKKESLYTDQSSSVDVAYQNTSKSISQKGDSLKSGPSSSVNRTENSTFQSPVSDDVPRSAKSTNEPNSDVSNTSVVDQPPKLSSLMKHSQEQDSVRVKKRRSRVMKFPKRMPPRRKPKQKRSGGIHPFQHMTLTHDQMLQKAIDPDDIPIIELETAREIPVEE